MSYEELIDLIEQANIAAQRINRSLDEAISQMHVSELLERIRQNFN